MKIILYISILLSYSVANAQTSSYSKKDVYFNGSEDYESRIHIVRGNISYGSVILPEFTIRNFGDGSNGSSVTMRYGLDRFFLQVLSHNENEVRYIGEVVIPNQDFQQFLLLTHDDNFFYEYTEYMNIISKTSYVYRITYRIENHNIVQTSQFSKSLKFSTDSVIENGINVQEAKMDTLFNQISDSEVPILKSSRRGGIDYSDAVSSRHILDRQEQSQLFSQLDLTKAQSEPFTTHPSHFKRVPEVKTSVFYGQGLLLSNKVSLAHRWFSYSQIRYNYQVDYEYEGVSKSVPIPYESQELKKRFKRISSRPIGTKNHLSFKVYALSAHDRNTKFFVSGIRSREQNVTNIHSLVKMRKFDLVLFTVDKSTEEITTKIIPLPYGGGYIPIMSSALIQDDTLYVYADNGKLIKLLSVPLKYSVD